jgi:hypothetical protein
MSEYAKSIRQADIEKLEEEAKKFIDVQVFKYNREYKILIKGQTLVIDNNKTAYYFLQGLLMGHQ